MERIFTIDLKNYDAHLPHSKRPSARAIIFKHGKLAMVYSMAQNYYKFPGGGIEVDEDHSRALIREVLEEVGMKIIPDSIEAFGSVLVLQRSHLLKDTIFEQESFYYNCEVEDRIVDQNLDAYENEAMFVLREVSVEEAIATNAFADHSGADPVMIERELRVLAMLKDVMKSETRRKSDVVHVDCQGV